VTVGILSPYKTDRKMITLHILKMVTCSSVLTASNWQNPTVSTKWPKLIISQEYHSHHNHVEILL
jgi:hypothetical protein